MKSRSDFQRPKDPPAAAAPAPAESKPAEPGGTTRKARSSKPAEPAPFDMDKVIGETSNVLDGTEPGDASEASPDFDVRKALEDLTWDGGFATVVDTFFEIENPHVEMDALRASLKSSTPGSSLSYGQLADSLNDAQENVMRGLELLGRARRAFAAYESDASKIEASMRESARQEIVDERGPKGTKPTLDDIKARMISSFPDEMADLQIKRVTAKSSLEMFEQLMARLAERAKDLRSMLSRVRRADGD